MLGVSGPAVRLYSPLPELLGEPLGCSRKRIEYDIFQIGNDREGPGYLAGTVLPARQVKSRVFVSWQVIVPAIQVPE